MESQIITGDALNPPLPPKSVDLVLGSPPYTNRRTYGDTANLRRAPQWVPWILDVTVANLAISKGPVIWVCNGCVEEGRYQPAVEGLVWEAYKQGIRCEHPLIWSKNATPNRKDWWCNGWEYIVAFLPENCERVWNWESIATEQKYKKGGVFRQRNVKGERRIGKEYVRNALARPYDLIRCVVGGGHMGHDLSGENEAAFPVNLVKPIILALTNEGDTVFDPFSGGGSTFQACMELNRKCVAMDIRENQTELAKRRNSEYINVATETR